MSDSDILETYKGYEIRITEDLKFATKIGGKHVKRASVSSLKTAIDRHSDPVKVIVDRGLGRPLYQDNIVRVVRRGYSVNFRTRSGQELLSYSADIFLFDKEAFGELEKIQIEYADLVKRLNEKRNEIWKRLTRLSEKHLV